MKDKLFLDDIVMPSCRYPETNDDKWDIVRNFKEFKQYILDNGIPKTISFDHDLGSGKNGNDCAKWLVEYCIDNYKDLETNFIILVHSMNPIGADRIKNTFKYFYDYCNRIK